MRYFKSNLSTFEFIHILLQNIIICILHPFLFNIINQDIVNDPRLSIDSCFPIKFNGKGILLSFALFKVDTRIEGRKFNLIKRQFVLLASVVKSGACFSIFVISKTQFHHVVIKSREHKLNYLIHKTNKFQNCQNGKLIQRK